MDPDKTFESTGDEPEPLHVGVDGDLDAPNFAVKRWSICMDCDRLFRPTRQCKECGCFMKIKVRLRSQHCPLGKW